MKLSIVHSIAVFIVCVSTLWSPLVYAAYYDSFTVSQTVTGAPDATSPSVPADLTATAISVSQIDLSWTASTDNVAVTGYKVFRDSVQIATSTVTTYSDTGLTHSTTYSYTVAAFDAAGNVSAESASSSATTLTPAVEEAPSSSGGGMVGGLVSLYITPGLYTADLNWETLTPVRYHVRWGRTGSYESGFLSTELFSKVHTTRLTGLSPDTRYEFIIITVDQYGNERTLVQDSFKTLAGPDIAPPSNVFNLRADVETVDDVRLTWQNPREADFSHVRILRSPLFYPSDPFDGALIYEGDGTEFFDEDALRKNDRAYYTVFTVDDKGNISSGALATARRAGVPLEEDRETASTTIELSLMDIQFIQDGHIVAPATVEEDVYFKLDSTRPFTILIPYDALLENLKTVMVTLAHPQDKTQLFSFLLRINKDKTAYEAQIAPLVDEGYYPTGITIVDYALKEMADVRTTIIVTRPAEREMAAQGVFGRINVFFFLLLIALLALGYWLIRRDQYRHV
jgi:hypothetical protein